MDSGIFLRTTDMRLVFKLSDNVHGRPISISERLSADGSVQQFFLDQWKPQLLQLFIVQHVVKMPRVEITVCHMGSENPLIRLILSRYNGLVMWNNPVLPFRYSGSDRCITKKLRHQTAGRRRIDLPRSGSKHHALGCT